MNELFNEITNNREKQGLFLVNYNNKQVLIINGSYIKYGNYNRI